MHGPCYVVLYCSRKYLSQISHWNQIAQAYCINLVQHNAEKTNKMEYEEIEYLNAIPHVVDVVVGVAHMFGHDRHPVHQTLWRRITGSGCSRRQMGVVTVRMGGSTWSCSRSRRGPCTWWACFGDMRMSRFRRWGPHERCFLYVNQQNTLVIE